MLSLKDLSIIRRRLESCKEDGNGKDTVYGRSQKVSVLQVVAIKMSPFKFLLEDSSWKCLDAGDSTSLKNILPATASSAEIEVVSKDWRENTSDVDESPISALISLETLQIAEDITSYSTHVLVVFGIFFCLFSVVVYASKQMRSPNSIYMVALNLSELICVLFLMAKLALGFIYGDEVSLKLVYVSTIIYIDTFAATAIRRAKYYMSCLLSAERCIAILLPLKSKYYKIVRYPLQTIFFVGSLSVLYHIFILMKLMPVSFRSTSSNHTLWKIGYTYMYVADRTWYSVCSFVSKVFFVMLPLLACSVFNLITVIALHRHARNRKSITRDGHVIKRNGNETRTTVVVLIATMVLVISALPVNTISILKIINPALLKECYRLVALVINIGRLSELLNNCLGFVFYMTLSSRFRKSFLEIFYYPCRGTPGSGTNLPPSSTPQETNLSTVSGRVTEFVTK